MSELKELSWEVQESVEPLPFDVLERRGLRRRRRRQTLTGAGVVAAVTTAVAAALLPLGNVTGTEKPPAATTSKPAPVDQSGEKLVRNKKAVNISITYATPTRWASVWSAAQPGNTYSTAAVLSRDGVRTTTPARDWWYPLRVGDEMVALAMPTSMRGTDPSWAKSLMVRLTDQGRVDKPLRWAPPTGEFTADEVLIESGTLRALNPATGTLREVKIPGVDNATQPQRDSTGRWWLWGAKSSGIGKIYWTDDNGKSWDNLVLDPDRTGGRLAVSPNGRTLVNIPSPKHTERDKPVPVRLSTDRGAHWKTITTRNPSLLSAVAFDDGTGLLLQRGPQRELLRLGTGASYTPPVDLNDLDRVGSFLYASRYPVDGGNAQALTSTDYGRTWKYFEPR